jgi:hypothetical protein
MTVPVDIFVKDDSPGTNPIANVSVSVVDPGTLAVIATALSDVNGRAVFSLPGSVLPGTGYEVRFFKLGVTFRNPAQILVEDPPVSALANQFDMSGTLLVLPAATDPRVCRCTGRFMSFSNTPIAGATVRIMARAESGYQVPKIVDGNIVSAESMALQTDADGFVTVDLVRGSQYFITFSGEDDVVWNILVPDRSSVNLIELIHPAPMQLVWDPLVAVGNAVTLAVGATLVVPFTMIFSDYEETGKGAVKWISFLNSDDALADVGFSDGMMSITAKSAGVVNVTTQMLPNLKPTRVPDYSISAPTLVVTITP